MEPELLIPQRAPAADFDRLTSAHRTLLRKTNSNLSRWPSASDSAPLLSEARALLAQLDEATNWLTKDLRILAESYALHWATLIHNQTGKYPNVAFLSRWADEPLLGVDESIPTKPGEESGTALLEFADRTTRAILCTVPFPSEPWSIPARDGLVRELQHNLARQTQVVLYGMAGVGKTSLAKRLAWNPHVMARFLDGILWTSLGEMADPYALLSTWCTAIGIPDEQIQTLQTVEARQEAIRQKIGLKCMLFVIDDAWQAEHARAMKCGGPNTSYLVTAYNEDIAKQFVGDALPPRWYIEHVLPLQGEDRRHFLQMKIPERVKAEEAAAADLVTRVDGSPLALDMIADALQAKIGPANLENWCEQLREVGIGDAGAVETESIGDETSPWRLRSVIEVLVRYLSPGCLQGLRALSIADPKPNSMASDAVEAIVGDSECVKLLKTCGLIRNVAPERWALHRAVGEVLTNHKPAEKRAQTAEQRFILHYAQYIREHEDERKTLCRDHANIIRALDLGLFIDAPAGFRLAVVSAVNALFPYLLAKGIYGGITHGFLERSLKLVRNLATSELEERRNAYLQEAVVLHNQGVLCLRSGDPEGANRKLNEALQLGPKFQNPDRLSRIRLRLGSLALHRGDYTGAEQLLRAALDGASEDKVRLRTLMRLAILATNRGNLELADSYNERCLELSEPLGDAELSVGVLLNTGVVAFYRREYEQAREFYHAALRLIGSPPMLEHTAALLQALGGVAIELEEWEQAERLLDQSLDLAQQIHHLWYEAVIRKEQGLLYLRRGWIGDAAAAFQRMEELAKSIQSPDLHGYALYGQAQVAAYRRNDLQALDLARQSLEIFVKVGHQMTGVIRPWLRRQEELCAMAGMARTARPLATI